MGSGSGVGDLPAPLVPLLADPPATALLTDFDGTLAPIVADPAAARALPGVAALLRALAGRFGVVGVVSGRPAAFLLDRLAGSGPAVRLVGHYGLEWVEAGEIVRHPDVLAWLEPVAGTLEAARAEAPPGVGVEAKGISLTLHWRQAPGAEEWALEFGRDWAERTGLAVQRGRMALELRPPLAVDKGRVVEDLAGGCRAAGFFGDDAGDLAAFAGLDRLAATGVRTVKVAVADPESPADLVAAADLVLDSPAAAVAALESLVGAAGAS